MFQKPFVDSFDHLLSKKFEGHFSIFNKPLEALSNKFKEKNKPTTNKIEISRPENFIHVNGVKVNQTRNSYDFQSNDDKDAFLKSIENLLLESGMKPNKKNFEIVDSMIKNNGGYLEFQKTVVKRKNNISLENQKSELSSGYLKPSISPRPKSPMVLSLAEKKSFELKPPLDTAPMPPNNLLVPPPPPLRSRSQSPGITNQNSKPDLMEEIRLGKKLNSRKSSEITDQNEQIKIESAEEKADMIDQLKDALNKMRPFIAS